MKRKTLPTFLFFCLISILFFNLYKTSAVFANQEICELSPRTVTQGSALTYTFKWPELRGDYYYFVKSWDTQNKERVVLDNQGFLEKQFSAPATTGRYQVYLQDLPPSTGRTCAISFDVSALPAGTPIPTAIPTSIPPTIPPASSPTPQASSGTDVCKNGICETAIGKIPTKPEEIINRFFSILLGLSGGIALILIIISGYRLMTSGANAEAVQGARETLTSAIVGLLFIIFSLVILEVIGVDILRIPGLQR